MAINQVKWRREGDDYEYRVSEWLNANTLKGLHEKKVSLAFFDPKIDIQALFKSQKFMYNETMIEILVLVEIIETRLHAKRVIFDKSVSFDEIDFFIVHEQNVLLF